MRANETVGLALEVDQIDLIPLLMPDDADDLPLSHYDLSSSRPRGLSWALAMRITQALMHVSSRLARGGSDCTWLGPNHHNSPLPGCRTRARSVSVALRPTAQPGTSQDMLPSRWTNSGLSQFMANGA